MINKCGLIVLGGCLMLSCVDCDARFVSADPAKANSQSVAGFNRYSYANNNPLKFIDPDGRVAIVTEMKNGSIQVNFPSQFKGGGATLENISALKQQIQNLSGSYSVGGKSVQVNFSMTDISKDTPLAARNIITLVSRDPNVENGVSRSELGGRKSMINVNDRFVDNGVGVHEVLHLADNVDRYKTKEWKVDPAQGNNIMNTVPGVVDDSNIKEIMSSKNNIFRKEGE